MIKSGEKRLEVRKWFNPKIIGKDIGLKVEESGKIEGYVKFTEVEDLNILTEDEKDTVLDLAKVPHDFREEYPCNYVYVIGEFNGLH